MGVNYSSMTQRKKPPPGTRVQSNKSASTDAAFDIWLTRGLHQMFDDVANEPVPDALMRLILDNSKQEDP